MHNQWPQDRKVMYRGQRFEYIKKQKPANGVTEEACVFCQSRANGTSLETLVLRVETRAMIVLNKFPYNPGHIMVLPIRHVGDPLKLEDEEYQEVMRLVKVGIQMLKDAFGVADFNIGMNLGRIAGAGIPDHLHVHIIPRWSGDLNFFPLLSGVKVIPMELDALYNVLSEKLNRILGSDKPGS